MSKSKPEPVNLITCDVRSPLQHDSELYAVGDAIELSPKLADELTAAGIVAQPKADKA